MFELYNSPKEWVEKVIENAQCGYPIDAAKYMHIRYGSSKEWLERIIEKQKTKTKS